MKVIITETKINSTIYNFIDKVFAAKNGNTEIHKLRAMIDSEPLTDAYDFVNDDYYSDEGVDDYLFAWTGKDYYMTLYSQDDITKLEYEKLASEAPTVELFDSYAKRQLNGYFGDLWKPVFKQWFKDKTGMDYKTLYSQDTL